MCSNKAAVDFTASGHFEKSSAKAKKNNGSYTRSMYKLKLIYSAS